MHLLELPSELIILLFSHLESLQDLHAVTLTCRALSKIPTFLSTNHLLHLASSPHTGLQPYPHLLIAVKARQLADWAVQDVSHQQELLKAIKGGCEMVLQLGLKISPLTLNDLRRIHSARFNILIPLSEVLDPKYGPMSSDLTVCTNLVLALTNFWIYCDLFHHSITEAYSSSPVNPLPATTRVAWLRFCVPDANCNPKFAGQFDQLDLVHILGGLEAEAFKIVTGRTFAMHHILEPDAWCARCVFHTGLLALTLLKTRSASLHDIEILNITREKIKDGTHSYTNADSDDSDDEDTSNVESCAWRSMASDIMRSWNDDWESDDAT
ncbi:hypothetical protein FRB93_008037 [Tulasnella sp. JGI-2019a]|nr:hypothetical protein FRB93_008037 [Tulasnella sp. JGI-2019a]